jgi:uroporphyrinogen-III synthase
MADKIPVILLKTKSTPTDGYESYFNAAKNGRYTASFAPVLEHQFRKSSLQEIANIYRTSDLGLSPKPDGTSPKYGGIIFTSQRAVEAFTQVINTLRLFGATNALLPQDAPFYVVGPATARGLRALELDNAIIGEETGNGDALATFILQHYNSLLQNQNALQSKPALLFLVGEQRRDIIPRTLQSEELEPMKRIAVDEIVVYETTEMKSFKSDFAEKYVKGVIDGCAHQWVVVFSPTGCKAMLESLGLLDAATGKYKEKPKRPFIATIGPTTRDYLVREFGFEPDVCAEKPSPEGVGAGISAYMAKIRQATGDAMDVDARTN